MLVDLGQNCKGYQQEAMVDKKIHLFKIFHAKFCRSQAIKVMSEQSMWVTKLIQIFTEAYVDGAQKNCPCV